MKQYTRPLICLAVLIALPWIVQHPYPQHLMILILMWAAIGSGWNLISGYTGQVLFGAAAFFGTGAYTAALLVNKLELSAWWGLPLGAVTSVLLAFPFGWISFRLRGPYFALVTLALNEIMRSIATEWESLTEGMVGLLVTQTWVSKVPYYYVALVLAAGSIVAMEFITRSRLGYYFVSIREDQDAAESLGINTVFYKMVSLCVSACMIGLAGALYTNYMGFIDPKVVFALHDISIVAILVGIVGGVGTIYGPLVGATIMVAVMEGFRSGAFGLLHILANITGSPLVATLTKYVTQAHLLAFGVLVIMVILYLPNGIMGDWPILRKYLFFWKRGSA